MRNFKCCVGYKSLVSLLCLYRGKKSWETETKMSRCRDFEEVCGQKFCHLTKQYVSQCLERKLIPFLKVPPGPFTTSLFSNTYSTICYISIVLALLEIVHAIVNYSRPACKNVLIATLQEKERRS